MSVTLPNTSATLASEYAANNISFNRTMSPDANGHLVASFSANIQYSRTDYIVDASGNKLNVVQRNIPAATMPTNFLPTGPMNGQDPYTGSISLQGADLAPLAATVPTTDLLDAIASMADTLIHADLVKRTILSAKYVSVY